jgi:hypothetical protein
MAQICPLVSATAAETAAVAPPEITAAVAPAAKTVAGNFDAAIKINSVFLFVGIKVVSLAIKAFLISDTFETFAISIIVKGFYIYPLKPRFFDAVSTRVEAE